MAPGKQEDTVPGRPRDPGLTLRILDAALAEYGRTGWAAFTVDGVARRARVGKAALYRRWPTKEHLLADAIEAHSRPLVSRDTGSLRGDSLALATALLEHCLDPAGWVTLRIAVDAATEPTTFGRFHARIVAMHRDGAEAMLQRALARGELPDGVDRGPFIEALYGAVILHVLTMPPDARARAHRNLAGHVTPLVDFVLSATGAKALPAPG